MNIAELLADAFDRIHGVVHATVEGLDPGQLVHRPTAEANTIAWLVWHLTRVQDDHVASAAGTRQVWADGGWVDRFALPFDSSDTGYSMDPAEVGLVEVESGALLTGYHDAVWTRTKEYVRGLTDGDLDRVVDERWDPPVTLGVRLVSVIDDDMQHAGQAAYLRGLIEGG
jgi:uncharacterized damage-inducible protein DinB